jgi:glucose/arabinose dehydrogenase
MNSRAAILCLVLLTAVPATAATLTGGFTESVIANSLLRPTAMAFAPDGRLFVCQQGGAFRVITAAGSLLATPFTTITVDANGERGLLGVAFDPAFQSNQFVYVYYTATTPTIHNRVSRFTANGDVAVASSEHVVVDLETLTSATNHNGGAIHVGPDGKLYVAVGENANGSNSQSFGNRLGKVLRINADGSIPSDNPFFNSASGVNRSIWALGLRNPFTFAFNRWNGEMFINDVGGGL